MQCKEHSIKHSAIRHIENANSNELVCIFDGLLFIRSMRIAYTV